MRVRAAAGAPLGASRRGRAAPRTRHHPQQRLPRCSRRPRRTAQLRISALRRPSARSGLVDGSGFEWHSLDLYTERNVVRGDRTLTRRPSSNPRYHAAPPRQTIPRGVLRAGRAAHPAALRRRDIVPPAGRAVGFRAVHVLGSADVAHQGLRGGHGGLANGRRRQGRGRPQRGVRVAAPGDRAPGRDHRAQTVRDCRRALRCCAKSTHTSARRTTAGTRPAASPSATAST